VACDMSRVIVFLYKIYIKKKNLRCKSVESICKARYKNNIYNINYNINSNIYNTNNNIFNINNNIFNININIKLVLLKFKRVWLQHRTQKPWMWV
jgi:hypothetical protein